METSKMKQLLHSSHARAWSAIAASIAAIGLVSGCNSQSDGSDSTTGTFLQNLTTDLGVCGAARDACMQAADGDPNKFETCKDERAACGDAVQAARKEIHEAIRACADTARTCWMDAGAGDAGKATRRQCITALRSCVEMALPPPPPLPPCAAALRQCLSTTGDGGADARKACVGTFHTCVDATLPPCMHALAACIEDRSEPRFACERQAQTCRRYRLTHDGGLPPPAPTTTGSGGTTPPAPTTTGSGGTTPPAPTTTGSGGTTPPAPTTTGSGEPPPPGGNQLQPGRFGGGRR
jgi:hypothetical protein